MKKQHILTAIDVTINSLGNAKNRYEMDSIIMQGKEMYIDGLTPTIDAIVGAGTEILYGAIDIFAANPEATMKAAEGILDIIEAAQNKVPHIADAAGKHMIDGENHMEEVVSKERVLHWKKQFIEFVEHMSDTKDLDKIAS